ncbi:MAG: hypothetical protein N3A62_02640 [Thermodesulfovibrionales bacterium]|nr:hypothetical protein [Thermodesulfovibrionales bacterium]
MQRIISLLITISLIITCACLVHAQDKKKIKVRHINGEVVAYDSVVKVMTVKSKKTEAQISLDEKTIITLNREKKTPYDIKLGDYVSVKYFDVDGKSVAQRIQIKTDTKVR